MKYEGALYRPPSESQSLLVQVTLGCSWGRCTFCDMYRGIDFKVRPLSAIKADILEGTAYRFKRVFLCDGDALSAPQTLLVDVLSFIRDKAPAIERVGLYADARSILRKKPHELAQLRSLGLGIIYHGIETGDDTTLKAVRKGSTAAQAVEAGKRVRDAGILYSAIVLLGIAGRKRSLVHARETARVLNEIQPDFVGVLTTMVIEGTPLCTQLDAGRFHLPSRLGLLEELQCLLENLDLKKCLLTTRHSSNYLPLRVVFTYERDAAVAHVAKVLANKDETVLKPDFLRNL